jgi:hypothetical protein
MSDSSGSSNDDDWLVQCEDGWGADLGFGLFFGLLWFWFIFYTHSIVLTIRQHYFVWHAYKRQAIALQGTVTNKSNMHVHVDYEVTDAMRRECVPDLHNGFTHEPQPRDLQEDAATIDLRQLVEGHATLNKSFYVGEGEYRDAQVGQPIDLLYLKGYPLSVKLKTQCDGSNFWGFIFFTIFFFPLSAWPPFVAVAYYLPKRIQRWDVCETNVLVSMIVMVGVAATATLLVRSCFQDSNQSAQYQVVWGLAHVVV